MSDRDDEEEFFVGYLPTPPRTKARNRGIAILAVLLFASIAVAAAASMASPGRGAFVEGARLTGILHTRPYGMLDVWDPAHGAYTVLLVRGGKLGLGRSFDALDGHVVTVQGGLISRDEGRFDDLHAELELGGAPRPATLDPEIEAHLRAVHDEPLGEVTAFGEIVDSKCWLGRMKPGGGRAHRACAQLCVLGGLPPLLVARGANGAVVRTYLIETPEGGDAHAQVLPFVAEPVRVHGALYRRANAYVLRTGPSEIERR